jgi:hypothetical protein
MHVNTLASLLCQQLISYLQVVDSPLKAGSRQKSSAFKVTAKEHVESIASYT